VYGRLAADLSDQSLINPMAHYVSASDAMVYGLKSRLYGARKGVRGVKQERAKAADYMRPLRHAA
jgi:hypothetical protein